MSALGQKQTCALQRLMSALPPIATAKADIGKLSCLLYPRKRTCAVQLRMSPLAQYQTFKTSRMAANLPVAVHHDPLPSLFTSAMGNENSSSPSSSCTRMDHFDHSSSKNLSVSNFSSCATASAWARAASISASSVPSTS